MHNQCAIILAFTTLCFFYVAANNCATHTSWAGSLFPDSFTKLTVTYSPSYNVQVNYVLSTSGNVNATIDGCSTSAGDNTLERFTYSLSEGVSSILLTLNLDSAGTVYPSSASKISITSFTLLFALLSVFFLLPKSRLSLIVLVAVICLGFHMPATRASSSIDITVTVYVPSQITEICENGNCFVWPTTATTTATSSSDEHHSSSSSTVTGGNSDENPSSSSGSTSASATTTSAPSTTTSAPATTTPAPATTTPAPATTTPAPSTTTPAPATTTPAPATTTPAPATTASASSTTTASTTSASTTTTTIPATSESTSATGSTSSATGTTSATGSTSPTTGSTSSTSATGSTSPTTGSTSSATGSTSTATGSTSSATGSTSSATGSTSSTTGSTSTTGVIVQQPTAYFNLRVLILAGDTLSKSQKGTSKVLGGDVAALAFDTVGTPYDYVVTNTSSNLSTLLSISGTGQYSGIVVIGSTLLSSTQKNIVSTYQRKFGVKLAVLASTPAGLPGVTAGTKTTKTQPLYFTLAPEFSQFAKCLNSSIRINNTYVINWSAFGVDDPALLTPATITDSSTVTPVINANDGTNTHVAAAVFRNATDNTEQLHYFMDQFADFIFAQAFSVILVNWLSPGNVFIGARRLTLAIQPDDLLLASNMWDIANHTDLNENLYYRITADDYQNLVDFIVNLNSRLPAGSHVTVEWPTNFGGVNDWSLAGAHDYLYDKVIEQLPIFFYLTHTWDHPCPMDNATYDTMSSEIGQNVNYTSIFFTTPEEMELWTSTGMITPCVTALHNGEALRAMHDWGILSCVSDESVTDKTDINYEPTIPYHSVTSTLAINGFDGMIFIPRVALDIDYCDATPDMLIDEFNYNSIAAGDITTPWNFEQIMALQTMYGIQDKVGFRHDPIMMHQANAATFWYDDPIAGYAHNVSFISLWTERVVDELMSYYNLPIHHPQMSELTDIFQQRTTMDSCGIVTTIGIDNNKNIVALSVSSTSSCSVSLSGVTLPTSATVTTETFGVEFTSWIDLTANSPQNFTLATPIPL